MLPAMIRRHDPGLDTNPASRHPEIVVPVAKIYTPQLDHLEPATLRAVLGSALFEPDHPVRDALHLKITTMACAIVDQQDGRPSSDEELLQGQDLPSISDGF